MNFFSKLFVTLFGIGFFPMASGTLGSICAILTWYFFITYFSIIYFYFIFIFLFLSSFYLTDKYLSTSSKEDPSEVIIDEFIGQSIPLLFIFNLNIYEILIVFSIFRFFDIFKIYPINLVERLKGSYGVILDDVLAGIYTLVIFMIYKILVITI